MSDVNVLLVEDDEIDYALTREIVCRIQGTHYNFDWKKSFDDGLTQILENKHDIYLIDHNLGGKDGLDLIKQALGQGHRGPFILLTGADQKDLYDQAVQLGAYDYILKSEISPSLMDRTITYALERKRIEDRLREEQEFSSFILSEIPYLMIGVNKDGNISSVNSYVTKLLGKSEKDICGKNWKDVLLAGEQKDLQFRVGEDEQIGFHSTIIDQDLKERNVYWHVLNKKFARHEDEDRHEFSFVLSGKDMTEQLALEIEQRQREKTEALGRLAGGVAHEINNLLQPILFSADVIKGRTDDEKTIKAAEKISKNTVNASRIVDDILTFARKDSQDNEKMPVIGTILETLELVEDMIPPSVTICTKKLDPNHERNAIISKTDMFRVINNMLINGGHAMNNEGTVELSSENVMFGAGRIDLGLTPGEYIKISVADHGTGIEKDDIDKIFTPFFTTKEAGEGTGLGLPIVYNIIKNWKGGVEVDSQIGEGTTFSYYIPVCKG